VTLVSTAHGENSLFLLGLCRSGGLGGGGSCDGSDGLDWFGSDGLFVDHSRPGRSDGCNGIGLDNLSFLLERGDGDLASGFDPDGLYGFLWMSDLSALFTSTRLVVLHPLVDDGFQLGAEVGAYEGFFTDDRQLFVSWIGTVPMKGVCEGSEAGSAGVISRATRQTLTDRPLRSNLFQHDPNGILKPTRVMRRVGG
jgi:hypothetical protein